VACSQVQRVIVYLCYTLLTVSVTLVYLDDAKPSRIPTLFKDIFDT